MRQDTVVLDVSSLAHQIGDVAGAANRANVHLASLVAVLEARGYVVKRLLIAVATVPVLTAHDSDHKLARRITDANKQWVEAERAKVPRGIELIVLDGAHDGAREIGVDDLVVAAALIEAGRMSSRKDGQDPDSGAVLVVSHDGDMDHIASYASPVAVRMVGFFDKTARRRLRGAGVSFDVLSKVEMRNCQMEKPLILPGADTSGARHHVPPPARISEAPTAAHTAIVDAYGLACSAACALGISRLPNVGSLRHLLHSCGYHSDSALLVTIPDIARVEPSDDELIHLRNLAWYRRDHDLDNLAREIDDDNDDSTRSRRGLLRPDRLANRLKDRLDRSGPVRAAKRVATQITADMVTMALASEKTNVVVITDSPHVVWVQAALAKGLAGREINPVQRLGLFGAPIVLVDTNGSRRLPRGSFRILTEGQIAQVTRTHGHVGRDLRQRMYETLGDPAIETVGWKVVGFDPEIDGVRVRNVDDPRFEMLLADSIGLKLAQGQHLTLENLGVELHFQPGLPTLVPVPSCQGGTHGSQLHSYADVVVLDRDGARLHFDVDGDSLADGSVELGHDLRPFTDGATAVLGRLRASGADWYFVSTPDQSPSGRAVMVDVVAIEDGAPIAAPPGSAVAGPLLPPPNCPPITVKVGDRLWAISTEFDPAQPEWIALSTPFSTDKQPQLDVAHRVAGSHHDTF